LIADQEKTGAGPTNSAIFKGAGSSEEAGRNADPEETGDRGKISQKNSRTVNPRHMGRENHDRLPVPDP
jgi:hypothetical protein